MALSRIAPRGVLTGRPARAPGPGMLAGGDSITARLEHQLAGS